MKRANFSVVGNSHCRNCIHRVKIGRSFVSLRGIARLLRRFGPGTGDEGKHLRAVLLQLGIAKAVNVTEFPQRLGPTAYHFGQLAVVTDRRPG